MQHESMNSVKLAQSEMANFVQSKKKWTCKGRVENGRTIERETRRQSFSAPWEEAARNNVELMQAVVEITFGSGAAWSVWPLRRSGVERSKKLARLAAASGSAIRIGGRSAMVDEGNRVVFGWTESNIGNVGRGSEDPRMSKTQCVRDRTRCQSPGRLADQQATAHLERRAEEDQLSMKVETRIDGVEDEERMAPEEVSGKNEDRGDERKGFTLAWWGRRWRQQGWTPIFGSLRLQCALLRSIAKHQRRLRC